MKIINLEGPELPTQTPEWAKLPFIGKSFVARWRYRKTEKELKILVPALKAINTIEIASKLGEVLKLSGGTVSVLMPSGKVFRGSRWKNIDGSVVTLENFVARIYKNLISLLESFQHLESRCFYSSYCGDIYHGSKRIKDQMDLRGKYFTKIVKDLEDSGIEKVIATMEARLSDLGYTSRLHKETSVLVSGAHKALNTYKEKMAVEKRRAEEEEADISRMSQRFDAAFF
ncbi:MAG: hypothetical protein HN411_05105 [Waddliaceae bacterium]|jgi:hypothetical protein|nr:hypothetical protein [Waddliaceae bacterium]MBT3579445.1 hypothetical protein [Waddliaceae bacterium]MBT4445160.1 hypothetical protein [Waddliaceae bacterium]MBT6928944.1 hypothetical protein [Waddliaceae bacterium]MBT7264470.1 hypothetical protein [Waddliaceae bacterium]